MAHIRLATEDDLSVLVDMDTHIGREQILNKIEAKQYYLMADEIRILGFLRYGLFWDEHPFMNMLYFDESFRGMGHGRELVKYWEDEMMNSGHYMLMTSTMVNEDAQHFYRKLGYNDVGGFVLPGEPMELILIKEC